MPLNRGNKAKNEQEPLRIYIRFKSNFTDKLDQYYILVKKNRHVPPKNGIKSFLYATLHLCSYLVPIKLNEIIKNG